MNDPSRRRKRSTSIGKKSETSQRRVPKSSIMRAIKEKMTGSKLEVEARELIYNISELYIEHLARHTILASAKSNKKILTPDHVYAALKEIGFEDHVSAAMKYSQGYVQTITERRQIMKKSRGSNIPELDSIDDPRIKILEEVNDLKQKKEEEDATMREKIEIYNQHAKKAENSQCSEDDMMFD